MEDAPPTSPSPTLSDDWEPLSSPPKSEPLPQASYTPSDPALISEYNKKPLPSIPATKTKPNSFKIQKKRPSTTDRLKLTCHHGNSPSDFHEVQTPLESLPEGASMIDRYAEDDQNHERIALGLDEESISMRRWRRAGDPKLNGTTRPRILVRCRINRERRREQKSEANRCLKRKREWEDDEQEKEGWRKTPPSPSDEA